MSSGKFNLGDYMLHECRKGQNTTKTVGISMKFMAEICSILIFQIQQKETLI